MMRPAEAALLLRTLAQSAERQDAASLPLSECVAFALDHHVAGPFLDALQDHDLLGRLSPNEKQQLVFDAAKTALWNQGYLDEAGGIIKALASAGVDVLVVRGPVMASRAYGDPLKRRFTDLDLLVRPADIDRAIEAMRGLGYETAHRTDRDIRRRGWKGVVEFIRKSDVRSFDVDLHTSLLNRRRLQSVFDLDAINVWETRTEEALPALSLEDELIFAIEHLVLQHQMEDIRLLVDCVMLLRRRGDAFDWPRLFARARTAGCETLVSCVLSLIGEITPLPADAHLSKAVAGGTRLRLQYPVRRFLCIENTMHPLRKERSVAWRWVAERQSVFCLVDRLRTAIHLALTESVPSAWRIRRLRSRKMTALKRMVWAIPMAAVLPWYIPVLMGHAALVRFLEPILPARYRALW
ncbi:MAG: nucleotidyltransferase family protein [Planctomycetes bacterium]|nr:nucleotidyltransferase family protein [Planctomycetota bacterium]